MTPDEPAEDRGSAPAGGSGRPRPKGREAVIAEVLDAATELFAANSPERVSVREIAASAGVSHGLVRRYFGTKDAILQAVLDRNAAMMGRELRGASHLLDQSPSFFEMTLAQGAFMRTLIRASLDGAQPEEL